MALFKSRKPVEEPAAAAPTETIDAMRRRARHRLIGAAVLVLVGVVGFPLLFDTQPRPIPVDIPIEIPDRNKVKPLAMPAAPQVAGTVAVASAPAVAEAPKPAEKASEPAKAAEAKPEPKVEARAETKPEARPAAAPASSDDGARAQALLEGKLLQAPEGGDDGRFVVQVGAFTDPAKARETRLKVEKAGMKTYTHVAETKDGRLIRVRVGPFATRAEADKAAEKIKGLELQARILTL
jgi:DedD protein